MDFVLCDDEIYCRPRAVGVPLGRDDVEYVRAGGVAYVSLDDAIRYHLLFGDSRVAAALRDARPTPEECRA